MTQQIVAYTKPDFLFVDSEAFTPWQEWLVNVGLSAFNMRMKIFQLKMMILLLKNDDFAGANAAARYPDNGQFCIKNDKICI